MTIGRLLKPSTSDRDLDHPLHDVEVGSKRFLKSRQRAATGSSYFADDELGARPTVDGEEWRAHGRLDRVTL